MLPRLAIVIPCYNEEEVLPQTFDRLGNLLKRLTGKEKISPDSGLYFVDDGSCDRTWALIEEQNARDSRFFGIKLSRNFGHQHALLAGLLNVPGDIVVSIDADLQDDVNTIESMIDCHIQGSAIVFGVRSTRKQDRFGKRLSAEVYYRLLNILGADVVFNHADFRLMSREAIEALREFGETTLFLRGIVRQLGFRSDIVLYERVKRPAGVTKYPFSRMLSLAIDGITSFSTRPLRLIGILGIVIALISLGFGFWALAVTFFLEKVVPGWASTVVPMYFLGGVQMFALGIIGEYVGKTYIESKRRPRYIIEKIL
jgi:glycosyltransferase involved in cell wall biosynthesis